MCFNGQKEISLQQLAKMEIVMNFFGLLRCGGVLQAGLYDSNGNVTAGVCASCISVYDFSACIILLNTVGYGVAHLAAVACFSVENKPKSFVVELAQTVHE